MTGFLTHDLGDGLTFLTGMLPPELVWDAAGFDAAWRLHPAEKPVITMVGRAVEVPRWQQAYGADYRFSGRTSAARPVPDLLRPLRAWACGAIDPRLNGLLVNWYDGPGHYIGPHHDSTAGMAPGGPVVTLSFGEERTFRLTRGTGATKVTRDFPAADGSAFVLPSDTNRAWKHAVPKAARYSGRRVSVTLRAFDRAADPPGRDA